MDDSLLLLAADLLLILHVLFVLFVVGGLLAIYLGDYLHWHWVRSLAFRIMHLLSIGVVVLQSWLGMICPLTIWEMNLRVSAGASAYTGSFIQYWLHKLIYFSAPEWVFVVLYTGFGALVLLSWYVVRPNLKGRER